MSQRVILSARDVTHMYPAVRGHQTVAALQHVSLDIQAEQFCSVVGRSGCGKTTLLRILAGLIQPSSGRVLVDGRAVKGPSKDLAVVFQEYSKSLLPWKTVRENVHLGVVSLKMSKAEQEERVEKYLGVVGLRGSAEKYPWQLSGGMQQRVAIARALSRQPRVLLLDEPFGALDAPTRFELEDQLLGIVKDFGITVFMITHDVDEAVYMSDRILVMAHSGILKGSPERSEDDFVVNLGVDRQQVKTRATDRFIELRSVIIERLGLTQGHPSLLQHV